MKIMGEPTDSKLAPTRYTRAGSRRVFNCRSPGRDYAPRRQVVFQARILTGYQEVFSRPDLCRAVVCLNFPHIGNVWRESRDEGIFAP